MVVACYIIYLSSDLHDLYLRYHIYTAEFCPLTLIAVSPDPMTLYRADSSFYNNVNVPTALMLCNSANSFSVLLVVFV